MKKVIDKNTCEVCGEEFDAEYIQHDSPEDDFVWEKNEVYLKEIGESEGITYPHKHEQPTVECHICPNCRRK